MTLTVNDVSEPDREVVEDAPRTVRGNAVGADCANCPMGRGGKPGNPVFGEGWDKPRFVIIGESPGQAEIVQQRPFVGASGRLVNEALSKIGVARESVFVTNSSLCIDGMMQVRLADGSLGRIDRLVRSKYSGYVKSVDATGAIINARVVGWRRNARGPREMRDISFRWAQNAGSKGKIHSVMTEDHPVLTPEGWRPAAEVHGGLIATGDIAPSGNALQVYLGTLLGDGTLQKGALTVTHAEDQREYVEAKAKVLSNIGVSAVYKPRRGNTQDQYGFRARAGSWGHYVRDLYYPQGKKIIPLAVLNQATILLFAIWFLDDGYMQIRPTKRPLAEICGVAFSESSLQAASAALGRLGFETVVRRGRIRFNVESTAKFSQAIAAFVPPMVQYKLRPEDRGQFDPNTYVPSAAVPFFDTATSTLIAPRTKDPECWVYCLDVEDTHNFILSSAVVHNCQPPHGATEATKKLARHACAPRLQLEMARFPGKPILALGAHAAQALTGDERFSITQLAGSFHEVDLGKTLSMHSTIATPYVPDHHEIIASIHPAAILRGGTGSGGGGGHTVDLAFWNLLYDAQKVNLLAQGKDIKFTDDIEIEGEDFDRARTLIADFVVHAREKGSFACDTETYVDDPKQGSALSPFNAKMSALGLATTVRGISIAWKLCIPDVIAPLDALFADPTMTCIFHNSVYDVPVLQQHDFVINCKIEDTLLMHHNAFPGLAHGLQRVGTQFYAIAPWKSEHRFGQGTTPELLKYNARDTLVTARIQAPLEIIIKRSNAEKTYEVDLAMAKAASLMHLRGVPVDRDVNEQLRSGFKSNIDRSKQLLESRVHDPSVLSRFKERLAFEQARRIRKHDPLDLDQRIDKRLEDIDKSGFNFQIDSGDHIVAFLKACGIPLSLQTASGRISTKKDVLEAFVQYPEVQALLNYRENAKLLSTFVERLFTRQYGNVTRYGFADQHNRIHPRWSVNKITSRWGSEGPQCQNWPKADPKKGRPNLRSQVVAPYGTALVAFDMKAVEARLVALRSGDPFMLDIFKNNKDIHSELAREIWPDFDSVPIEERKVRRDLVKRPEYATMYASSAETAWRSVVRDYPNVTLTMVGRMINVMKTKMVGIARWHQECLRLADQTGEIKSMILGRRRCFPIKQFDLSETVNFGIQSTGAELVNIGLMEIMPLLPADAFPILQIHDAVIFQCAEDDQDRVKELVIKCFTREVTYNGNTMHFPVDAKSGKSWAEVN